MKHRLNLAIEKELIDAAKQYASEHYISVTQLVRNYFLQLKLELERSEQSDSTKTSSVETK